MDTNIVIDALGNVMSQETLKMLAGLTPIVSAVTYMEALGWHKASVHDIAVIKSFMSVATILPIDQFVIEKTVLIRQQKKIALGDSVIAATALVHGLTLMTRNSADFKNIADLKIMNPWEKQ